MFVRVKKIGAYEYLYLVENAREGGRHVQRVIKALGRRDEVEASGLIDGLIASAARHSRRTIVLSSFYRGELPELRRVSIGPDLVFGRLWAETGCRDVLTSLLADRRFGFDVERAVYLTVLHRLTVSGSDRHASEWRNGLRVPGAEGLGLDEAYKAMAWLGEIDEHGRGTAEAIEEALYRHRQPLFGAVSIAFFDTTTLWFEGAGGENLGQRGHSKDYRGHLKQVVLGIVLDDADRPIASFLMPGNTADVTMLLPVVRRLRDRFDIARTCIVADRGMISAHTMAALEAEKIEYILVARPADVGVKDRDCVGTGRIGDLAVELVVEDRAHRAVGQGADLDGAHRCCFETLDAERPDQAHDTQAGAEALFRVRPALQDQLAQAAVAGPITVASWRMRSTVQSA